MYEHLRTSPPSSSHPGSDACGRFETRAVRDAGLAKLEARVLVEFDVCGLLFEYFFQGIGEDKVVEVNGVNRGAVGAAMDSGLAEVDALRTLGF